jgi:hypothetical protein
MMHFISNSALGMLLAWSLQCQAESNSNLAVKSPVVWDGQISDPNINPSLPRLVFSKTTSNNLCIPELAGVETMGRFLGTNHPVSIATHSDAWGPEKAKYFLVTGTSLTEPATCDVPLPPLLIEEFFLRFIKGEGRLDEAEITRRRTIIREIVSEEEPELVEKLGREDFSNWLKWVIPDRGMYFLGNFTKLSTTTTMVFTNSQVKERILQAIGNKKTTQ